MVQGPELIKLPSPVPGPSHPSPGLTSGPFLLDLLLKDALFFFLLALRVFCKGIGGVDEPRLLSPMGEEMLRTKEGLTWGLRARRIQVGGMTTAACTPREQGSSICCSMKQDTLLWYWKTAAIGRAELGQAETGNPPDAQHRLRGHLPPACTRSN